MSLPNKIKRPGSANAAVKSKSAKPASQVYNHTPKIVTEDNFEERPFSHLTREELEVTLRVTKTKLKNVEGTVSQLRAENQRFEAELLKQQKRLEKFLEQSQGAAGAGKSASTGEQRRELEKSLLVRQLKTQVMMLRSSVAEKEMEIEIMRKSQKNSKLIELSSEKEEYFIETMRLKHINKELRDTLEAERKRRTLDAKKAGTGEEIRREVAKLTSGYQNILKGMSSSGGAMVGVLQGGKSSSQRPGSAQPVRSGAAAGARRPQSASKGRPLPGDVTAGLVRSGGPAGTAAGAGDRNGGGRATNNIPDEYADELEFFTGELDNDAEQMNLNLKATLPSPSPGRRERVTFQAEQDAQGDQQPSAPLVSISARGSTASLVPLDSARRGGYVEVFVSKIVASNLRGSNNKGDNSIQLSFTFSRDGEEFWRHEQVHHWSAKAHQVFTLGRIATLTQGLHREVKTPDLLWVCSYRDLQMGLLAVTVVDKGLEGLMDDDDQPVNSALGEAHNAVMPLPQVGNNFPWGNNVPWDGPGGMSCLLWLL